MRLPSNGLAPGLLPAKGLISCAAFNLLWTQGLEGELPDSPPESHDFFLRWVSGLWRGLFRGLLAGLSSLARGDRPCGCFLRVVGLPLGLFLGEFPGVDRGVTLGLSRLLSVGLRELRCV